MARLELARVRELVERAKAGDVEAKRELARILEGAGYDIFNAERPGRFEPVEDRFERWDRDWEDVPDDAERVERIDEEFERLEDDEYVGAKRVRRLWPGY
jgi:hypothetical protein